MKSIVQGDLIKMAKEGKFDVIVHGCNCFCVMGAGIALAIRQVFPQAYAVDIESGEGNRYKLGNYSKVDILVPYSPNGKKLTVVNAYTQYTYGRNRDHVDYDAVARVFKKIHTDFPLEARIGLPMIGSGLGGGNWTDIQRIIEKEFADRDYTIVSL